MIQYLEYKNINKQKWDTCLKNSTHPSMFAYSWYLDAVCDNWSGLVLDDYDAVFPIAFRSKYKINYILQPFFTRYYGVYSANKISEKLVDEFLSAIPEKFKYIQFCLHEKNNFRSKSFETLVKKFQFLNLSKKYDELQKKFSDNTKRNIKKAIKANLTIRSGVAPEKIANLFKVTKGNELKVFKPSDYKKLILLLETCLSQNIAQSIGVYDDDRLCAAGFFILKDEQYLYLIGGVTDEGRSNGAMHLLFDYFIKENSEKRCYLDFGGSAVESVARFYKNFGAEDCVYLQVKRNTLPPLIKWISGKS